MTVKLAIVGEAWGADEERERAPFVGASGRLLTQMLNDAGLFRYECFLTNCFNLRPKPTNDITNLCGPKASGIPGLGPVAGGKYIRAEFAPELDRLRSELRQVKPNLVVAAGGTASTVLVGQGAISKIRGAVTSSPLGFKVLPTFHPAAVIRDMSLRYITVLDLMKAKREKEFPEIRRPKREVWIEPSLRDMEFYYDKFIKQCSILAVDIETIDVQISCIGFAPDRATALVVPFIDWRRAGGNYWASADDEGAAWRFVRMVLSHPSRKLFQNGLYDMHFLWKQYGIPTVNADEDTMLLHHALQMEAQKGLGFLGSIYTNEPAWKLMRGKTETIKRDE